VTTVQNDNLAHDGQTTFLPTSAHFLLNDKCNAKCVFCGGNYFNSRSGRMMTLEKFKIIADNIHLEHYRQAILAGAGDPLLCPDFVPIMQHLHAAYPTVEISVTTNGIALNRELGEAMLACGIKMLNISLNAATKDTYLRLMQVDAFDRICEQIRDFSKLCREHGRGPQLQLSIPIMRCNVEELPLLIQFAHEVGAGAVNVFYCRFYPREIRNDKDGGFLPDKESLYFYQELSDRIVTESERLAQRLGVQLMHEPLFSQGYVPKSCSWTDNELMIGFDGEVFPCGGGELHFKKKLERGEYNFGNALQQPIEEFWNNGLYRAIRVSSKRSGQCVIPECRECSNMTSHMEQRGHILEWADFSNGNGLDATDAMSPFPLVSVIVPTHNRPEMLKETIQSIFDQTFQDFEIVVVNDAGQDVSSVVHAFKSPKITYISHETNKGLAASRNTGIRTARGKYIAYLDDDDIFYPEHLNTLVTFLQESGESVAYTDAYRAHQIMQEDGTYAVTGRDVPYSFDFNFKNLLVGNFIPVTCFMHDIKCIHEAGYFDEDLHSHEDWDLWIRISQKFSFHHIKKLTCEFRWREDGTSMTSSKEPEFISTQERIYEKYQHIASKMPDVAQAQQRELYNRKKNAGVAVPVACSIIIPVFNQIAYTKLCLEMLYANTPEDLSFEVIIIDNASSDGTAEFLNVATQRYRNLWVIRNNENLLFAKACNQGAQAAGGEYLVFLNNDTEPLPGWLEQGLARLKSDPAIGIVGSKLLYPDGTIQHCGIEFLPRSDLAPPYNVWPMHRYLNAAANDPRVNTSEEVPMVTGACLFISKKLFQAIDGFCPDYGLYFEDIDLCMKVHKQGKIIWYEPQSVLVHHESKSSPPSREHLDSMCMTASVLFYKRWLPEIMFLSNRLAGNSTKQLQKAAQNRSFDKTVPVRVLYDISVLGLGEIYESARTGIYRVVEHVVQGLAASSEIQLAFCATQAITEQSPETVTGCRQYLSVHQEYQHIPFFESGYPAVDIFHSPFHAIPDGIDAQVRFLTVYDLIPIMFPQLIPPHVTRLQQITFSQAKPGDQFICISQATKNDLCRIIGVEPEYAMVTHLAADPAIFYQCFDEQVLTTIRLKYGIGSAPYILSLCTLEPRKNIDHVIRAFARLVRDRRICDTKLVLTGTKGWDFNRIFNEIDSNPELHTRIVLTGYVPDEDLAPLYSGATVFVYMSLYEGFGLPPLEAMQCGVPAITSNTSSLPEVVGNAGIMLDPQDIDSLCRAMHEVVTNRELHKEMSKRSLLQAANFSWDRCVEETISAYKSALSNQKVKVGAAREPAIVIDGVIFQLQHGRPFGISRLWWSLLTEMAATPMAERIVLLDREGTAPEIPGIRRRRVSAFQLGTAREEAPELDRVCCEEKAGLFISTYYTFTTLTPSLLMLYDMIPERFDSVGPNAPNPEWRDKHHAIVNSSAFAAISQSTARDLTTFYPQASERQLSIIPCAVSDDFRMHSAEEIAAFKSVNGIDRPYFLLVGRRDPHKNAALFFKAFASLPERERYAIVMAGGGNALEPELRALAGPAAGYAGFFSDRDLSLAYSGAIALVYPSLYEGFGLPILEAMQSGCPVITCQNSSLPEVAGSAALYVGEQDVEGMSRALLEVQDPDVRAYLIKRGVERARLFSWQKGAELLTEAIQKESGLLSKQSTTPSSHPEYKEGVFLNTEPGKSCESIASQKESSLLISAIVSTYNSERYIRGCIEDLERQTIADQIEIIVIDSCSPEQEGLIVHELQQVYSNIRYIRTEERETVYAAWNRAIQVARGRYLTNANTDDRHRADAFERMAAVLNDDPAIDLVYADALITTTPNETFEQCTRTGVFTWLEPDRNALLYRGCFIGPQPLWRKSLHEVYGLFDPKYITSGDYEFWLRVSQTASFHHIAEPLGLYLSSPTSIEHTNEERKGRENNQLLFRYRNAAIEGKLQGFMPFSQLRSILSSGSWGARQDDVAKLISYIGTLVNSASHRLGHIYGRLEQEILSSTVCSNSDLERFISLAGRMIVENSDWYTVDINSIRDEAVLQGVYVRQIIRKARLLAMRNEFDGAVETLLQQGIRQVSGDQAPYLALMEILIVAGRLNDALEVVAQLPEGADRVTVQYLRAVCHEKLTEYDAAQKCAADAFTMAPDDARVLTILGVLAFHRNQREEAIRLFEEALLADPGFGEPYANLGVIRWTAGEREVGFSLLEQAATLSPLDNDIRALYYGAAGESNAYSQAEQHFKDEAAMYPESRGVIRFLLDVLEKQGKNNEAMERLEEALVRFGCDDDLLDMALEVRNRIGRPPKIREKDKNSISLCMIVKNEASDLAICLSSTKPVADEMIVIDTGSSDRTADIATAFGARVYNFTWNGNFSDARNYAINKARGRWILVMDADEVLAMKDYETVRRAVREASGKKLAWSVLTRNYTTRVNAQGWTQNDHAYPEEVRADGWHPSWKVRLFPHDRRIRFSGEVHEMVEHSLRQAGFNIKPASFIIHHYGGLNDIKNREKMLHYFELGRQKLGENPDDGIALQELATQAGELELYDEAINLWDRLLQIDPNNVDALFNKGYNLIGLRRYEESLVVSKKVLELEPFHKEGAFNYGTSELYAGEPAAAIQRIEPILQKNPDYPPLLAVMTLLYLLSDQREKAVATFTKLKTLNYAIVEYAKDRGLMLSKLGKEVKARKLLDECAEIGMDVY